jgi:integrase
MHHMMEKASVIWSKETGIDRNPADQVEVYRPDDQRERYLSAEEIGSLKCSLDKKTYRADTREINRTFYRLRMIVLIALATGMRIAEIFGLTWNDLHYSEGLIAVSSKLKGGKIRYVPMTPELAVELRKYPAVIGVEHLFGSYVMWTLPLKEGKHQAENVFGGAVIPRQSESPRWPQFVGQSSSGMWPVRVIVGFGRADQ